MIYRVKDVESGNDVYHWSTLFKIENGIFTVLDFSTHPTYEIFIKAMNDYGAFGGTKDYLIARMTNKNPINVLIPQDN